MEHARHDATVEKTLLRRARRLEIATLVVMLGVVALVGAAMGASQAMKAAWLEDVLSLVPAVAFLVARRVEGRDERGPDGRFPWGRTRATGIAFLAASLALLGMGAFILLDSLHHAATRAHPTLGLVDVLGVEVWAGWLMIAALVVSALPPVVLGHLKRPLALQLHEKPLHADAEMQRADWLTAAAGIVGVLGIGVGWWWLDPAAALVIGVAVARDGWRNVKVAVLDLMDSAPTTVGDDAPDPIVARVRACAAACDWVRDVDVRLREHGRRLVGEVVVVPRGDAPALAQLHALRTAIRALHWRLDDVVCVPVAALGPADGPSTGGAGSA